MEELLKSLYIKLDSTAQSLTKDAIGQLLIKIIYSINEGFATKHEILQQYDNVVKNHAARDMIDNILSKLVENKEVKCHKGKYYLSSAKKSKITKALQESQERIEYIIDKYFVPFYSPKEAITLWFKNVLLYFFENYSQTWVADLCYHKNSVCNNIDSIVSTLEKRIRNHKEIDERDYKRISAAFANLLTKEDPRVDELFWEYGTSQFMAQLIKNSVAADKITIETFSGATCVLDTNVLIYLGLEVSGYHNSLATLEKTFEKLGINVGILYITKSEYENTIRSKSHDVLQLLEKYDYDVLEKTQDDFVLTAKRRCCSTIDDYNRFFKQISTVPSVVDKSLQIKIIGESKELLQIIESAQNDGSKIAQLNHIYRSVTSRDKKPNALRHDVGMIAGVRELRKEGKYFILSQEPSVNGYAKLTPSENELPIAINIETLINVLAINSYDIDTKDYITLFANIIRMNLQPNRETFRLEDLSYILEKNQQIAQLSPNSTIEIAKEIHRDRLLGIPDEEVEKKMTRLFQGEKLKIANDLDVARQELSIMKEDNIRVKNESQKTRRVLSEQYKKEAKRKALYNIIKNIIAVIIIPILLFGILWFIQDVKLNLYKDVSDKVIPIIVNIILALLYDIIKLIPKTCMLIKNYSTFIKSYVQEKIKELDDNG